MRNPTYHRVLTLSDWLNGLQAALARASANPRDRSHLNAARSIAADLAAELEDWHLDLLHIPPAERSRYVSVNPYVDREMEAYRQELVKQKQEELEAQKAKKQEHGERVKNVGPQREQKPAEQQSGKQPTTRRPRGIER